MALMNTRLTIILSTIAGILLIPAVAMPFTTEVSWDTTDFLVAGILLLTTGLTIELVKRKVPKQSHRAGLVIILIVLLVLIWAEIAVGIIGSPIAGS